MPAKGVFLGFQISSIIVNFIKESLKVISQHKVHIVHWNINDVFGGRKHEDFNIAFGRKSRRVATTKKSCSQWSQ